MSEDDDARAFRELLEAAVQSMARARGDEEAIKAAITAYLCAGLSATDTYHSPAALTDYFCVDTPSILDDAGYSDTEGNRVTELFDDSMPVVFKELHRP